MKLGPRREAHDFKLDPDFAYFETATRDTYDDKDVQAFKIPDIADVEENFVDTYDQYVGARVHMFIGRQGSD
jgi:hypothetical protein